jgi:hypothetical protein
MSNQTFLEPDGKDNKTLNIYSNSLETNDITTTNINGAPYLPGGGGVQNPMTSDLDLGGFRIVDDSGGDLVIEQKNPGQNISLKSGGAPLVNLTGAGLESFGRTTLYDQLEFIPSGPLGGTIVNLLKVNNLGQPVLKTAVGTSLSSAVLNSEGSLVPLSVSGSITAPANTLKVGTAIRVKCWGSFTTNTAVEPLTLRFKIGGTTRRSEVVNPMPDTSGAVAYWEIIWDIFMFTDGATGTYSSQTTLQTLTNPSSLTTSAVLKQIDQWGTGLATIDTTVSNDIEITGQWSNAGPTLQTYGYEQTITA